jgi:hypothetical protein
MAVIQDGAGATLAKVRANNAQAVNPVPTEGGQYSAGFETTSLAFTNNVVVWDFRNPTANLMLIHELYARVTEMAVATHAATGLRVALQLFVGRNYTALSATSRTALTLTTNNVKLRTSYPTSGAEIGFASAVGGITGGTLTEDVTALRTASQAVADVAAAAGTSQHRREENALIWRPTPWGGPIVLAQNEGVRIRYLVTTAAAAIIHGHVSWNELGTTVYP